jgi:CheY-like chemotaxis protein
VNQPPSRPIIVEDGDEDALILTQLLDRSGAMGAPLFRTSEAALEALELIAAAPDGQGVPTAAFIDVCLPGISGFELLRWIRQNERLQSMVVVLLSASDEPRNLGKAIQLGADCFLIKFPPMSVMRDVLAAVQKTANLPLPRPVLPVACNLLFATASR